MSYIADTILKTLALALISILLGIWVLILINIYNLLDTMGQVVELM